MPGNTLSINNGWRNYYVGDSKMPKLIKLLEEIGVREKGDKENVAASKCK